MNKGLLVLLGVFCCGTVHAADFIDTAKVVSSVAIHERVSDPKQECWIETVTSTGPAPQAAPVEDRSIGGALLGGVVGGVVGNQVGQGSGNAVATAAGAIAGALIGDRVANEDRDRQAQQVAQAPQVRKEKHCREIENYRDVIRGYDVTYRYAGKDVTIRMPYEPGDTVKVGVSVIREK